MNFVTTPFYFAHFCLLKDSMGKSIGSGSLVPFLGTVSISPEEHMEISQAHMLTK